MKTRAQPTGIDSTIVLVCLLGLVVFLFIRMKPSGALPEHTTPRLDKILFVGDVMLARGVETLMEQEGESYPLRGVRDLFAEHADVVGNFEASVPEPHQRTPHGSLKFSVSETYIPALARAGFTHLTLANNHALDYGKEGYANTKTALASAGIATGGHPLKVTTDEVLYTDTEGVRVAIIPLNALFGAGAAEATTVIEKAAEQSDAQIVFIHWGEEYAPAANKTQRALARGFIDAGADAIIGHHPHVVQDIEVYRGAPIFYSLGNFVFDQYWNKEVQEGLAVALSFAGRQMRFGIIPVSSVGSRSAPRPLGHGTHEEFLQTLAARSDLSLRTAIASGSIATPFARKSEYILVH